MPEPLAAERRLFYLCSMSGMHVIWFKRDLRVHDHAPLLAAVASGAPVIPVYIHEPGYWAQPEHSRRQFDFITESLQELDAALQARGSRLLIRTGPAQDVFAALHREFGLEAIHAHEETGLQWSLDRDRQLRRWARNAGIALREQPQHGVLRAAPAQGSRAQAWDRFMSAARGKAPEIIHSPALAASPWPIAEDFGLGGDDCPARQPGGRTAGVECLRTFLEEAAGEASSRLSPHLAFGTVSIREAWQAARRARDAQDKAARTGAIDGFLARLDWHCRALQALEDQTSLESRNLHPEADGLRPRPEGGDPRLEAWIDGRTGFPFLDACLRSLKETGWLGFRARTLVMGFAAHLLWMDWKVPAERLAARFTDFEPAIHYAQVRLQAATRGKGAPRIPDPVALSLREDPTGQFIRRWVPELARLPDTFLHAPWEAPASALSEAGVVLGQTYPMRMVDHVAAAEEARTRIAAARRVPAPDQAPEAFQARSKGWRAVKRRRPGQRRTDTPAVSRQLSLDLGLTHAS